MAAAAHMRPGPKFFQNCGGKKPLGTGIAMEKIMAQGIVNLTKIGL